METIAAYCRLLLHPFAFAMEKKQKRNMDNEEDRISNLPEFLMHQILSYLPPKEAARTTALNKTWLQSYSTSPTLTFYEYDFIRPFKIENNTILSCERENLENRYRFFNFVNNTLLRYTRLNLRIHKLEFYVRPYPRGGVDDHERVYRLVDELLRVAFDNDVQELGISFEKIYDFSSPYTLPTAMFDSPKLLTYLRVGECKFPQNGVSNSKCSSINFPFLRTLCICRSYIDDGMLQKLLLSSPSLEEIVFFKVFGFKKFRVSNLGKLKILDIKSRNMIEIEIEDATSLRLLRYSRSSSCFEGPCLLKVGNSLQSQNLKFLQLYSVSISDNCLEDLIAKSPLLEDLQIQTCDELERVYILSSSLKHLDFDHCKMLVEARIDAPNLLKLIFYGENMLSLSLNNTPDKLKTFIYIDSDLDLLNNAWFKQLRKLLKAVNQARVSFHIQSLDQGIEFGIAHDSRENPLTLEHQSENFMPHINQSSSLFSAFMETLFSSSHPATIDTSLFASKYAEFVKFLSNELMTTTRNPNCCSSDQTKCWRHYLKDIKVEVLVYKDSQKVWRPLPQKISLSEFSLFGQNIRFSLKWCAKLNAEV